MLMARLSSKNQIAVPEELVWAFTMKPGDELRLFTLAVTRPFSASRSLGCWCSGRASRMMGTPSLYPEDYIS